MAKKEKDFSGIAANNKNIGKDSLFHKKDSLEVIHEVIKDEEIKIKNYPLPLPETWHKLLKFDLAQKHGKSMKDLILDAIAEKYNL